VADALLEPTRIYARAVRALSATLDVRGMAHITGGGIPGNLVRILPPGCEAVVDASSWDIPPLFSLLQRAGGISTEEMRDVFNLGVGLIAVLPSQSLPAAQAAASADGVATWTMGEIRSGPQAVRFARS
jgi:phosphoribosylformylglycinamidine cyclo-ligase